MRLPAAIDTLQSLLNFFPKDFQIRSIPRAILVGKDGVILAVDSGLREEQLDKTLTRVFDCEPTETDEEDSEPGGRH